MLPSNLNHSSSVQLSENAKDIIIEFTVQSVYAHQGLTNIPHLKNNMTCLKNKSGYSILFNITKNNIIVKRFRLSNIF